MAWWLIAILIAAAIVAGLSLGALLNSLEKSAKKRRESLIDNSAETFPGLFQPPEPLDFNRATPADTKFKSPGAGTVVRTTGSPVVNPVPARAVPVKASTHTPPQAKPLVKRLMDLAPVLPTGPEAKPAPKSSVAPAAPAPPKPRISPPASNAAAPLPRAEKTKPPPAATPAARPLSAGDGPALRRKLVKFLPPDLLAEVEHNFGLARLASAKPVAFQTRAWERFEKEAKLPPLVHASLAQIYVDIRLANSIVQLAIDFNRRSPALDQSYLRLCGSIAEAFDRLET